VGGRNLTKAIQQKISFVLVQKSVPGRRSPADRASLRMQPFAEILSLFMSLPDCCVLASMELWPGLRKLNFNLLGLILGLHASAVVLGEV